jgi:ADP-ribose pyrophosphatase
MEKTVSSQLIYQGKIISVRLDEVLLPDGRKASREVVEHPGAVAILAVNDSGEAYFVRQYRQAVAEDLLEIPAGKLEPEESPAECAVRELAEEAGVKPKELRQIALYYSSPGFASERLYLFLATGLEPVEALQEAEENLQVSRIYLPEAIKMAREGKITDGKTIIALLLAADLL